MRLNWTSNLLFLVVTGLSELVASTRSLQSVDIFQEVYGSVVVEAESVQVVEPWKLESQISGYTGNGYLRFDGNTVQGGDASGVLRFFINIQTAGNYTLNIRSNKNSTDFTTSNDCYVRMVGYAGFQGIFQKTFMAGTSNVWRWKTQYELNNDSKPTPYFSLEQGVHELQIAGRSRHFAIDRVVLYDTSSLSEDDAQSANAVESSSVASAVPTEVTSAPFLTPEIVSNSDPVQFPDIFVDAGIDDIPFVDGNVWTSTFDTPIQNIPEAYQAVSQAFETHRSGEAFNFTFEGFEARQEATITLGFAENWIGGCRFNKRVFDVLVNSETFVQGLDIFNSVGCYTALVLQKNFVADENGSFVLDFLPLRQNPMVSIIGINPVAMDTPPTSLQPGPLTASPVPSAALPAPTPPIPAPASSAPVLITPLLPAPASTVPASSSIAPVATTSGLSTGIPSASLISGLSLANATDRSILSSLTGGDLINLDVVGSSLTIVAATATAISRLRFSYDGLSHTDAKVPYAMKGKAGATAFSSVPYLSSPGEKEVKVDAFDGSGLVETAIVTFTVTATTFNEDAWQASLPVPQIFIDAGGMSEDTSLLSGNVWASRFEDEISGVPSIYDSSIFQAHRSGQSPFVYKVGGFVAGSMAELTLGFAENYFPNCRVGKRVMSVIVNSVAFIESLDVFSTVGCYEAVLFTDVFEANSDGEFVLEFLSTIQNPMVSLIAIDPIDGSQSPTDSDRQPPIASSPPFSATDVPSDVPSDSPVESAIQSDVPSALPSDSPSNSPIDGASEDPSTKVQPIYSFLLVNATTKATIRTLQDGDVVDIESAGSDLSVVVETTSSVERVRFGWNGNFHTDSNVPYSLNGKNGPNSFNPVLYLTTSGEKTITAQAYDEDSHMIGYYSISFQVVQPNNVVEAIPMLEMSVVADELSIEENSITADSLVFTGSTVYINAGSFNESTLMISGNNWNSEFLQNISAVPSGFDAEAFKSHRSGRAFNYTIDGFYPSEKANVTLGFAENYFANCYMNKRTFDVTVNGLEFAYALDVFGEVQCDTALVLTREYSANTEGQFVIDFKGIRNKHPMVSLIKISSFGGDDSTSSRGEGGDDSMSSGGGGRNDSMSFAEEGGDDSMIASSFPSSFPSSMPSSISVPVAVPSSSSTTAPGQILQANLVRASDRELVRRLSNGVVVDLGEVGSSLSIRVTTRGDVSHVRFKWNGNVHTDGTTPFVMRGKNGSTAFNAIEYFTYAGTKTVSAEAFNSKGIRTNVFNVHFDIVNDIYDELIMEDAFVLPASIIDAGAESEALDDVGGEVRSDCFTPNISNVPEKYDMEAFMCHRSSTSFNYTVIGGLYPGELATVSLGFAENYFANCHEGKRTFNVTVNGDVFATALDVFGSVGCYSALVITKTYPADMSGNFVIQLDGVKRTAMVSLIAVDAVASSPPPPVISAPESSNTTLTMQSMLPSDIPSSFPSKAPTESPTQGPTVGLSTTAPSVGPAPLPSTSQGTPNTTTATAPLATSMMSEAESMETTPYITSVTLVNATTQRGIFNLVDGSIITLNSLPPYDLSIVVQCAEEVTRVRFKGDGIAHTDSNVPYVMAGKTDGGNSYVPVTYLSIGGVKNIELAAFVDDTRVEWQFISFSLQ